MKPDAKKKSEWKQAPLEVKKSPFNSLYGIKRWFDKWDAKLKYEEFYLSWEVWWLIIWSIVYAGVVTFWLRNVWSLIPERIPLFYGYHTIDGLVRNKSWLVLILFLPSCFGGVLLLLMRWFYKEQRTLSLLWVILIILMSFFSFTAAFKSITVFGDVGL